MASSSAALPKRPVNPSWLPLAFLLIAGAILSITLIAQKITQGNIFPQKVTNCEKETCIVTVNYSARLSEYISSGRYQWINPAFTDEHFGVDTFRGIHNVSLRIIALPNMPIDRVLDELTKQGYRPATSRELLAMIASGVLENFQGTLVAPGTLWKVPMGHVAVPAFENIKGFKTMEVFGAGVLGWRDRIFFAAVPIR